MTESPLVKREKAIHSAMVATQQSEANDDANFNPKLQQVANEEGRL